MAWPFRRRVENVMTGEPPFMRPNNTTIVHHHTPGRVGTIFGLVFAILIIGFMAWIFLIVLMDAVGFRKPQEMAAYCVLTVAGLFLIFGMIVAWAKLIRREEYAHKERMAQLLVQAELARSKTANLIPPTVKPAMTVEDTRKYLAVKQIMNEVYGTGAGEADSLIDEEGKLKKGVDQPWARRNVGHLVLVNHSKEIGEGSQLASWVKHYLTTSGILLDDRQVNLALFRDLNAVEAQLVQDFGRPIAFNSGDAGVGMSGNYLTRGGDDQSWS